MDWFLSLGVTEKPGSKLNLCKEWTALKLIR